MKFSCNKQNCFLISCLILGLISIILAIIIPIIIEDKLNEVAREKVIMSDENINLWGNIPGETEVYMIRKYFIYNFTNIEGFLFNNEKPKFVETGPYIYRENQNYSELNYTTDENGLQNVHYSFWQFFTPINTSESDLVTTLNMGSLGIWYQAKTAPKHKIAIQVLSGLILSLEDQLYTVGLAQGISSQYVKNQTFIYDTIFFPNGISITLADFLWNDEEYGWNKWQSLRIWVEASINGIKSGASNIIKEHFGLSNSQITGMLTGYFQNWISSSKKFMENWFCPGREICDSRYLAALQIAQQGISKNPPGGGIKPSESIAESNETLRNWPEIPMFLKNIFLKDNEINATLYQDVIFDIDWVYEAFAHTKNETWLKDQHLLLHVGNLDYLFLESEKFEKTKNLNDLENLRKRLRLNNTRQTHVFIKYLNYMVEDFALEKKNNGTSGISVIATLTSQTLYEGLNKIKEYLLPELRTRLILSNLTNQGFDCLKLINQSGINPEKANKTICFNQTLNKKFIINLINICNERQSEIGLNFMISQNLTKREFLSLCSANSPSSFSYLLKEADLNISLQYNCSNNKNSCSHWELAIKQWGSSEITLNPPKNIGLESTKSIKNWNNTLFEDNFEFSAVISKDLNYTVSKKLLTFDRLFNQMTRFLFIDNKNKKDSLYFDKELVEDLQKYLQYIMIKHSLQGFARTRTAGEILWGYDDPLIKIAKNMNPQQGGDPSLNPRIIMNNNWTFENSRTSYQSVYTGIGDISKVRQYQTVNDVNYSVFPDTDFNGNESFSLFRNPWKVEFPITGTDSFANPPGQTGDSEITIYMPDVCSGGKAIHRGEMITHHNVETMRYRLAPSFLENKFSNPYNHIFYRDKWDGAINLTTVKKMPVFLTKFRFMGLNHEAVDMIEMFDQENNSIKNETDSKYDTYIDVESYTGAGVAASLNVLTSYEYQSDELFTNPTYALFPVFGFLRPGVWSDSAIDSVFSDLILALKLKTVFKIGGACIGSVLLFIAFGIIIYKWRKGLNSKEGHLLPKTNKETDVETNKEDKFESKLKMDDED